jgi:hypothetical protein
MNCSKRSTQRYLKRMRLGIRTFPWWDSWNTLLFVLILPQIMFHDYFKSTWWTCLVFILRWKTDFMFCQPWLGAYELKIERRWIWNEKHTNNKILNILRVNDMKDNMSRLHSKDIASFPICINQALLISGYSRS